MPRKKKIQELNQIDGKQEKFIPTTLSQIWGDTGIDKYKTLDIEVYKNQLKSMNLSDLRTHAVKIGLIPNKERERLEKQLIVEFRKYANLYQKPQDLNIHPKDISKEKLKAALDIMSEAK